MLLCKLRITSYLKFIVGSSLPTLKNIHSIYFVYTSTCYKGKMNLNIKYHTIVFIRFVCIAGTFDFNVKELFFCNQIFVFLNVYTTFTQRLHNVFKRCGNVLSKRLGT